MSEIKGDLTLYGDLMSAPTRAVHCFLMMSQVPFTFKEVSLIDLEHLQPEYQEINPGKKVPAMVERGADGTTFKMFESHAIMRYISETRDQVADHWYPKKDPLRRARIDEYLDWHHLFLRLGVSGYISEKYQKPFLEQKPRDPQVIGNFRKTIEKSLNMMENYWLRSGEYLTGSNITLADISAACELA